MLTMRWLNVSTECFHGDVLTAIGLMQVKSLGPSSPSRTSARNEARLTQDPTMHPLAKNKSDLARAALPLTVSGA